MHNIHYFYENEKVNRDVVLRSARAYADRNGDYEGQVCGIRWVENTICENEAAAHDYIEKHDQGWYDNLAVRYYDYPVLKKNKRMETLEERMKDLNKRLYALQNTKYADTLTSTEYVGCKECGSKIATKYLKTNYCPVCRADMRPKTTLDKLEKLKERIAATEHEYKEEEKAQQAKQRNKAVVKWLVKIEFHS